MKSANGQSITASTGANPLPEPMDGVAAAAEIRSGSSFKSGNDSTRSAVLEPPANGPIKMNQPEHLSVQSVMCDPGNAWGESEFRSLLLLEFPDTTKQVIIALEWVVEGNENVYPVRRASRSLR